jgi:cardiolipin synthase A/B
MQESTPRSSQMIKPDKPHIPFVVSGSYPVRPGNLIRPLIDGEPAFRRICEAVEAARHSVWVMVAFIRSGFRMPDNRGSLFDLLDRAAERGLDVRMIFWRPNRDATYVKEDTVFAGSQADRDFLDQRGSRFRIRWDRTFGPYCQHQKSWLVDAGQPSETAFVGGINLNPRAMVNPGHAGGGGIHDAYAEVRGPSATDVHHNFVQRWNEASERAAMDGVWGEDGDDELAFPNHLSGVKGSSIVQIQRNVHAGRYHDGTCSPGAQPFNIADGESAIRLQYLAAMDAARRSIYIENQALTVEAIVIALGNALRRGVEIVVLLPADPEAWVGAARQNPQHKGVFDRLASLGRHENFALAGIAGPSAVGIDADRRCLGNHRLLQSSRQFSVRP